MSRFEAFEDLSDEWRWRLMDPSGHVVATSGESYGSHHEALRAARGVREASARSTLREQPGISLKAAIARLIETEERRRLESWSGPDRRRSRDRRGPAQARPRGMRSRSS